MKGTAAQCDHGKRHVKGTLYAMLADHVLGRHTCPIFLQNSYDLFFGIAFAFHLETSHRVILVNAVAEVTGTPTNSRLIGCQATLRTLLEQKMPAPVCSNFNWKT